MSNPSPHIPDYSSDSCCSPCPLNRFLVLCLLGGYATLLLEIRAEHVDVVRLHWQGWIPICYAALMILLTTLAILGWNAVTRTILFWAFFVGLIISPAGLWFHNHLDATQNFKATLQHLLASLAEAWSNPKLHHEDIPPHLAPLAFAGLSLIGLAATAKACQPSTEK